MTLAILLAALSFSSHFVQQKQTRMLAQPIVSEGILTYKSPDYVRWEYTSPQPIIWETDGKKNNLNALLRNLLSLIQKSIKGDWDALKKDFDITQNGSTTTLTPKKKEIKNFIQQLKITLNPTTQLASKVEFTEPNGDHTVISFSQTTILDP